MVFRFGSFALDEGRFELRRDGEPVKLEPRALDLLLHLARHAGHVVSKEELVREVWHGKFVTDSAVTYAVAEARRALASGEDAIATVHGRGYRFVAELLPEPSAPPPAPTPASSPHPSADTAPAPLPHSPPVAGPVASPAPAPAHRSHRRTLLLAATLTAVAVAALLLRDGHGAAGPTAASGGRVSIVLAPPEVPEGDVELHLLAVSLLDSLGARLAQVKGLRVLTDPEPAAAGAASHLALALARDPRGDRGQLRVFLEDPAGGARPAGRFPIGRYDVPFLSAARDLERFNGVREEIARRLVELLLPAVALAPARPGLVARDPEAYRLYLAAQDRISGTTCDNEAFVEMLRGSLARDADFAPAWEVLGWEEYGLVAFCGGDRRHYDEALVSAERALALVPDWAPAVLLKMSILNENGRWVEAWRAVESAAQLGLPPGVAEFARSYLLDYVGEIPGAVAELGKSVAADPLFLSSQGWAPNALLYARQEKRYLELLPAATSPFMRYLRGVALARLDRSGEAREILRPAFAINPSDIYARLSEALLLILEGDRDGGETILRALDAQRRRLGNSDGETTFWIAELYARTGDATRAVASVELALDQGFACDTCVANAPALAALPRLAADDALRERIRQQASERRLAVGLTP